jgi:pimeloyl-ACP methyl ester carboxylesterase
MIVMRSSQRSVERPTSPELVLLPGSGSDEVFLEAAFGAALRELGLTVHTVRPRPGSQVVDGYLSALDEAAERGAPLLVGGVSLGAQVAARWAARRLARGCTEVRGLLLALPAWTGPPGTAPAALAAASSAATLRANGLAGTLDQVRPGVPGWLFDELARAWTRHGAGLADSLDTTARSEGPSERQLAALRVPVGLVGLTDDPLHPIEVARRWHALVPCSALVTSTLAELGADRRALGEAAALAWRRASSAECAAPVSRGDGAWRAAPPGAAGHG